MERSDAGKVEDVHAVLDRHLGESRVQYEYRVRNGLLMRSMEGLILPLAIDRVQIRPYVVTIIAPNSSGSGRNPGSGSVSCSLHSSNKLHSPIYQQ